MSDIRDVARLAKVSVSTVSYAFSGKRPIRPQTYERVMNAAKELDYAPNAGARMMRSEHKNIVALSAPLRLKQNKESYADYFIEMARQEHERGYDSLLLTAENGVEDIRRVTRSNLADGVILMDIVDDDIRAAQAATYGRPCIAIGLPRHHSDLACVDLDFELMGRMAIETLHDKGRTSPIFLKGPRKEYERRSSYRLIMRNSMHTWAKRYGMHLTEAEQSTIREDCIEQTYGSIRDRRVDSIISEVRPIQLLGVVRALQSRGIVIPDDVSVISCAAGTPSSSLEHLGISEMPLTPQPLCAAACDILTGAIEQGQQIAGLVSLRKPTFYERTSV